jgi:uncharacterized protein (DUF169 family)
MKRTVMNAEGFKELSEKMISILDLNSSPVGISLISDRKRSFSFKKQKGRLRYCQALMKARGGETLFLDKESLSCPAASAAFGFRPLPAGYRTGKALVGLGVVSDEAIGKAMMGEMPRLNKNQISLLHLYPLSKSQCVPDIVIVEDEVEKLMWISLSYINAKAVSRIIGSTAALQATCVDSTIIPYLENRLNYSYGCHGCRGATDMKLNEAIIGFPGHMLTSIVKHLEFINQKAIPESRSKKIFKILK